MVQFSSILFLLGYIANSPSLNRVWTFNDDRIGPITMDFEEENCCNRYPWPGNPGIKQDTYGEDESVGLIALAPGSGPKYNIETTTCDGDKALARVAIRDTVNDDYDTYTVAFPHKGKAIGCPDGKRRAMSFKG
ncbi:hypothetical protein BDV96DRAFT_580624 [Lophiotrema nucula]|uniref:Uncharacterized protein n=1 Tax=Lophiotrema nucula TaxID=690887 RepID=A0A6A5YZZ8_9PLEO|nr:hypothetical protein BDV96DRAFT_580624 [Lophiotrema nucula]